MLFCLTANFTPEALNTQIEDPPDRRAATERLITAAGGELVAMYGTIAEGPGLLVIFDADPDMVAAISGVATADGSMHDVKVQRLLSMEELFGAAYRDLTYATFMPTVKPDSGGDA